MRWRGLLSCPDYSYVALGLHLTCGQQGLYMGDVLSMHLGMQCMHDGEDNEDGEGGSGTEGGSRA